MRSCVRLILISLLKMGLFYTRANCSQFLPVLSLKHFPGLCLELLHFQCRPCPQGLDLLLETLIIVHLLVLPGQYKWDTVRGRWQSLSAAHTTVRVQKETDWYWSSLVLPGPPWTCCYMHNILYSWGRLTLATNLRNRTLPWKVACSETWLEKHPFNFIPSPTYFIWLQEAVWNQLGENYMLLS